MSQKAVSPDIQISELEIRNKILSFIKSKKNHNQRIVEEFGIGLGDSRIDIAVINGSLDGYEIKSDYDTLKRLPGQIERYSSVVDNLIIVSTEKHFKEIRKISPKWCGLILITKSYGRLKVTEVRKPKKNSLVNPLSLVQLLWRDELVLALTNIGQSKGLSKFSKHDLYSKMVEAFDKKTIKKTVCSVLFSRQLWRVAEQHA